MRNTEEMKIWLFDLCHGNLSDEAIVQGFVKHYVLHDLEMSRVHQEARFHTHYSPEQIEKGMSDLRRVMGTLAGERGNI